MVEIARQKQLTVVQGLVNQALKLDPLAQQRLQALAGKSLRLQCTQPEIDIVIAITAESIGIYPSQDYIQTRSTPSATEREQKLASKMSCHLSGDFNAFSKLLMAEDKAAALINTDLRLQGDSALLIELEQILGHIELDWEFHLAKIIGDMPAHFIGQKSRQGWQFLRNNQPVFKRHLQEFILEEARLTPNKIEMDDFIESVQNIDQRVERLQARIQRITRQLQKNK